MKRKTIAALVLMACMAVLLTGCGMDFFENLASALIEPANEETEPASTKGTVLPYVGDRTETGATDGTEPAESSEEGGTEATFSTESTESSTGTEATVNTETQEATASTELQTEPATQATSGGTIVLPFVPAE